MSRSALTRRLVLLSLVALAGPGLLGAGCTRQASTATPTALTSPAPSPSLGEGGLHVFPELEQRLPQSISGRRLTTVSLSAAPERQDPKTLAVLGRLGRSATDIQLANGELVGHELNVSAMRIVGAQGDAIIAAFRAVDAEDADSRAIYTDLSLGGKGVVARTLDGQPTYLYGDEDIMFIVSGEPRLAEAALALLP